MTWEFFQGRSGPIARSAVVGLEVTGDYYVRVSGMLVSDTSDTSGTFGANISLAPVPEPET